MVAPLLYSYLNLESTKTFSVNGFFSSSLYSYLNLESTKTEFTVTSLTGRVVQLLKS